MVMATSKMENGCWNQAVGLVKSRAGLGKRAPPPVPIKRVFSGAQPCPFLDSQGCFPPRPPSGLVPRDHMAREVQNIHCLALDKKNLPTPGLEQWFSALVQCQDHLGSFKDADAWAPPPRIQLQLTWSGAQASLFFRVSPGGCPVQLGLRITGLVSTDFSRLQNWTLPSYRVSTQWQ